LLPYENQLAKIRVTGEQLKRYLEQSARHYALSWEPELYNRDVPFYNFDTVDGVSYALDLGQPAGNRVKNLAYQGKPVKPEQTFSMAITTYRLRGGGGYMDAIGYKSIPELVTKATERNLLLEYVLGRPSINPASANNWRTIPYLDRERVLSLAH
jgi:2',3'-cyclic-nucleotide 2'-phosphodiesterase/3'-nucleotidase